MGLSSISRTSIAMSYVTFWIAKSLKKCPQLHELTWGQEVGSPNLVIVSLFTKTVIC